MITEIINQTTDEDDEDSGSILLAHNNSFTVVSYLQYLWKPPLTTR